ncbi:MAG: BrnT family toxin [Candidatus Aminicenantales bacterium]
MPIDVRFEWDENKNAENEIKRGVSFYLAQHAFFDPDRVIIEDRTHSHREDRYYCLGRVGGEIITVRFTFRVDVIRIFGAGYWRKGKRIYERKNRIQERS